MMTLEKCYLNGKYEQAIIEADRLIDARSSRRYEVYYLKGLSELKSGRFAGARETFGRLIEKYPSSPRAFDANIGIGDSYYLAGNKEAAAGIYKDAIRKYPGDKNVALAREKVGQSVPVVKTIQNVQSVSPAEVRVNKEETPRHPINVQVPKSEPVEGLAVQVGSFKSRKNADNLSKKLRRQGYESYVEMPVTAKDGLYRVKVGHLKSRDDAEKLAARLKVRGYPTRICPD
jgi:tetratricopeptide (TPR) repeat protein